MARCLLSLMFLAALVLSFVYGQQRVCLQLELEGTEAIGVNRSKSSQSRGIAGKQGPKGEPGADGVPGPKGDPGIVDYDRITEIIDQKINDITEEYNRVMETMTQKLNAFEESSTYVQESCDGILYQGRCFIIQVEKMANYEAASSYCSSRNAQPANIYDQRQNDLMVAELVSEGGEFLMWTGMIVNPRTKRLTLRDGSAAPFTNWWPDKPDRGASERQVYLYINTGRPSIHGKMGNDPASSSKNGVICEVMG